MPFRRSLTAQLLGVVVWTFENGHCDWLQSLHPRFGPFAPLLEVHAWWHALTGYGAHCMAVGACHIVVVLRDGSEAWRLERWYGIWSVVRTNGAEREEKSALLDRSDDE